MVIKEHYTLDSAIKELIEKVKRELDGVTLVYPLGDETPKLYLSPYQAAIKVAAALQSEQATFHQVKQVLVETEIEDGQFSRQDPPVPYLVRLEQLLPDHSIDKLVEAVLSKCVIQSKQAGVNGELLAALKEVCEVINGLSFGEDWNKGTHAKVYRPKLLALLPKLIAIANAESCK